MISRRLLIVNADDFGQSPGVNRGIIESHEQGIVTSTSLMVRWAAAADAAAYARQNPRLAVGLHLDLGEWSCQQGEWRRRYQVVPEEDGSAVRAEMHRQLERFRQLMGRDPSHLDSHQHIHREEPARTHAVEMAHALGIPLRHLNEPIHYCGAFYGQTKTAQAVYQAVSVEACLEIIHSLPSGLTELACHPGYADDLESDYRVERSWEIESLCDPRVRAALDCENVQLTSFASHDVREQMRASGCGTGRPY